jgi:arginine/lysine/ornithine decarboxylase
MENIKELIEEINSRKPKDYEKMSIKEVSDELHKVMEFEQVILKKIKLFEDDHQEPDLIKYAKMIYKKIIERETILIQETYLKKIDSQYLNS